MFNVRNSFISMMLTASLSAPFTLYADTGSQDLIALVSNPGMTAAIQARNAYRQAILQDNTIDKAVAALQQFAARKSTPAQEAADAYYVMAQLQWQHGLASEALSAVDNGIAKYRNATLYLLKAKLLDAAGDSSQATQWYRKTLKSTKDNAVKEFVTVRLAILDSESNAQALATLAASRDQSFKNRAATVLALQGNNDQALALYHVNTEEPSLRYKQYIRQASWAIKTEDYETAKEHAWQAWRLAKADYDALYALSLFTEACSANKAQSACIDFLARQPNKPVLQDIRIDQLVELQRYDDAIALINNNPSSQSLSLQQRQRLIQLYLIAGKPEKMVAQYRRLIDEDPHNPAWYESLASHFMNIGQPEDAFDVWEELAQNNAKRQNVIIDGASAMIKMGFFDDAISMVKVGLKQTVDTIPSYFFLFDAYLSAGQENDAVNVLTELQQSLPEHSPELINVADAWERISRADNALEIYEDLDNTEKGLGYDQRMRLAWLYSVNGEKAKALALWQTIWLEIDSPSRRGFAETQLLQLSAELNKLADMVVALEEKLALGTASKNEINLLVRIYVEVGDKYSAIEVIEEYARNSDIDELEKQRQLSKVYMILDDYQAYGKTLERLAELEPEFKSEHIRNRILSVLTYGILRYGDVTLEQIDELLAELRQASPNAEAIDGEFEAGIMNMTGYNERAIESYRRVIAANPERTDNLLLLAELMGMTGRKDEAITGLQ
jgi:predicted Zn-dependent protease